MSDGPELAPLDAVSISEDDDPQHTEEWVGETQGIDRVISVALSIEQPRTVEWIAEEAHLSESAARGHLERLVDLRVLGAVKQRGATTYYPDSAYQRFREVSRAVEEHDRSELESLTVRTKKTIEGLQETYDVDSPEELRMQATSEDVSSGTAREYFRKASEWDGYLHTLDVIERALEQYDEYSGTGTTPQHTPA